MSMLVKGQMKDTKHFFQKVSLSYLFIHYLFIIYYIYYIYYLLYVLFIIYNLLLLFIIIIIIILYSPQEKVYP
jgi:hypothetical protein